MECAHPVPGFLGEIHVSWHGVRAACLGTHMYGTEEIKKNQSGEALGLSLL